MHKIHKRFQSLNMLQEISQNFNTKCLTKIRIENQSAKYHGNYHYFHISPWNQQHGTKINVKKYKENKK